jgi:dipeptidyl aminopeptidase/acylaminoacyl peptidase
MVIRLEFLVVILCLLLPAGRDLAAQGNLESRLNNPSCISERIKSTTMSEDGAWLAVRKRSIGPVLENNTQVNDTILIFDLRNNRVETSREQVTGMSFIGSTHLLISNAEKTELFNLTKHTSVYFEGVNKYQVLKNKKQFLLHYNKEEQDRLELRDSCGTLLKTINNVNIYSTAENGHIYSVGDNETKDTTRTIFNTTQKVLSLEADPGEKGLIVHIQNPDDDSRDVLYLDLTTRVTYSLKDVLKVSFQQSFSEPIEEGNMYYLRLWIQRQKYDSSFVDIWNGNDNKLEEKFYSLTREVYYVWEPVKGKVQRIGSDTLIRNANIENVRYFLSCDPYLLQDYTKQTPREINVYDRLRNIYSVMDTITEDLNVSPGGNYALYLKNGRWHIYNIVSGTRKVFGDNRLQDPCFTPDGKMVVFGGEGGLWNYDPLENKLTRLDYFEGFDVKIINTSSNYTFGYKIYEQKSFDIAKPLLLELYNSKENRITYLLWKDGKSDVVVPLTGMYIRYLKHDNDYKHFTYLEEDYNMPPRLVFKTVGQKEKVIYQSNKSDTAILSLKQEIVSFKNRSGVQLTGTLYYPLHFNTFRKYPMVVHIYAEQHYLSNHFLFSTYNNNLGFNIRLLLEKGYFVYMPDIVIRGKNGPGIDALDCVDKSLDALTGNPYINMQKIGLIGHSFGGYETDFIATHSKRFAAYISGSGHSDLIWSYHTFNYNFLWPEYIRIETDQYKMKVPFSGDKSLYYKNNPILYAEKVNAPVLLWSGLEDKNVTSDNSMAFYNALRRNGKNVIALYYKGEGHDLQTAKAQNDLTCRILEWLGYFLQDDKGIEWISKGIKVEKKDAP